MPGGNCAIYGCNTSRIHVGISLHKVPQKDDDYSSNWRRKLVDIIVKDRELDASLKKQIEKKNLYICELHFTEDQLIRRKLVPCFIFSSKTVNVCQYKGNVCLLEVWTAGSS